MNHAKKKLLINCSNLHVGGGVAVASSFISQLEFCNTDKFEISLLISSEVSKNLDSLGINYQIYYEIHIINIYGFQFPFQKFPVNIEKFDAIFSVFGPTYFSIRHKCHVVGLANPYLVYLKNSISNRYTFVELILHKIKCYLQLISFSKASAIVVELPNVKYELELNCPVKLPSIYVVLSAIDRVFFEPKKWKSIPRLCEFKTESLKLGVIAKNYPHKNLEIFPFVKKILEEKYAIKSDFYVTLTAHEWSLTSDTFKDNVRNVGPLNLDQCPDFYRHLDGVVFPTLLECFSAVPLEAMLMKKRLFVSNFDFIRDICGEHCIYFDPFCANDIAEKIYLYYLLPVNTQFKVLDSAYEHALMYPNAQSRANSYLTVIQDIIENERAVGSF